MIILSHRGYWRTPTEKNQPVAFHRSFDLGFGTETDLRDLQGELVISHDPPSGSEMNVREMLDILGSRDLPIAVNIKADGLAIRLQSEMAKRGLTRWFTFDMSVPELVVQLRHGLPAFTRSSEFEMQPACYDQATGVWLDAFSADWYKIPDISTFLADGKQVCVVSPELHGRDPTQIWSMLKNSPINGHPALMLCTDDPEKAKVYFRGAT